jgi:RNA polymerase sigma factor (sigma-70 family)
MSRLKRTRDALTDDDIARLYRGHAGHILAFIARRTLEPELAVDLMAEAFAQAYRDRAGFRGRTDADAVAWIFGIARHCLASYLRTQEVERRALTQLGVERRPLTSEEYERVERLADLGSLSDDFAEALDALAIEQREAVRLRVIEERSYSEVAHELGVSEQTARARVSRGLRSLRMSPMLIDSKKRLEHG